MASEIFNWKKVAAKMDMPGVNIYHRVNYAMKGATGQLDEVGFSQLEEVITEEYNRVIANIKDVRDKQRALGIVVTYGQGGGNKDK